MPEFPQPILRDKPREAIESGKETTLHIQLTMKFRLPLVSTGNLPAYK